jgi:hypothetical protein
LRIRQHHRFVEAGMFHQAFDALFLAAITLPPVAVVVSIALALFSRKQPVRSAAHREAHA